MKDSDINWGPPIHPRHWGFTTTKAGLRHSNLHNIGIALEHDPSLAGLAWYDAFLDRLFTGSPAREWSEVDEIRLAIMLQGVHRLDRVTPQMVGAVVADRAKARPRHAVADWLEALAWDGTPRIATAFEQYWGAKAGPDQPEDYLRAVSANFLISLVSRVVIPGSKVDTMPVFEGSQGIGKSRALEVLGGPWYAVNHESVASKDFFQVLGGKWLIELAELDTVSRAEVTRVKSTLSANTDRYRKSYARLAEDHPRQCVFAGTVNLNTWGRDETGLRRFWPVACGRIDVAALAHDRAQLFAEALTKYRRNDSWWEVPASALTVQADRQYESAWQAAIADWLGLRTEITLREILTEALHLPIGQITRIHELEAARCLRLLGWSKHRRRPYPDANPAVVWVKLDGENTAVFDGSDDGNR